MNPNIFPLNNISEIEEFERHFNQYFDCQGCLPMDHISLNKASKVLQVYSESGRLFTSLVDIVLTVPMISIDLNAYHKEVNKIIDSESVFGEESEKEKRTKSFNARMQMHSHANAFILRYRSAWDKIMGFIVLLNAPEEYEKFGKESRKTKFKNISTKKNILPIKVIHEIDKAITYFDNNFRTSEAHGTGILRKSSFTWTSYSDSGAPLTPLIPFWNHLNSTVYLIGKWIENQEKNLV